MSSRYPLAYPGWRGGFPLQRPFHPLCLCRGSEGRGGVENLPICAGRAIFPYVLVSLNRQKWALTLLVREEAGVPSHHQRPRGLGLCRSSCSHRLGPLVITCTWHLRIAENKYLQPCWLGSWYTGLVCSYCLRGEMSSEVSRGNGPGPSCTS